MRIEHGNTKKKKDQKEKKKSSGLEYEIFKIMEKSLKTALDAAIDDVLKDWKWRQAIIIYCLPFFSFLTVFSVRIKKLSHVDDHKNRLMKWKVHLVRERGRRTNKSYKLLQKQFYSIMSFPELSNKYTFPAWS